MDHPPRDLWRDSTPQDARTWLASVTPQWWVAGGWAVDLHLGRVTRAHGDLDVGCFREDLATLRSELGDWAFYAASAGRLTRLEPKEMPARGSNSVWCHPVGAGEWRLEVLLDERDGPDWVFRRCSQVRCPVDQLTLLSADGARYLRPEVQLLYKAKASREKDEADLRMLLPALEAEQRAWLERALAEWQRDHAWLSVIRRAV